MGRLLTLFIKHSLKSLEFHKRTKHIMIRLLKYKKNIQIFLPTLNNQYFLDIYVHMYGNRILAFTYSHISRYTREILIWNVPAFKHFSTKTKLKRTTWVLKETYRNLSYFEITTCQFRKDFIIPLNPKLWHITSSH